MMRLWKGKDCMAGDIIICTRKTTYILYFIEFIIFIILSILIFYFKETISKFIGNLLFSPVLLGIISIIFLLFGLVGSICCVIGILKPQKFVMKINDEGFETLGYGFVKWSDITKLNLDTISGSDYITFNTREPIENKMNKMTNKMFSNPYVISLFYTGISAKELYKLMQQNLPQ